MYNKVNRPTMGQLVNVLLAIDRAYTVPQRALYCVPGFGWLSRFIGPTIPLLYRMVVVVTIHVCVVVLSTDCTYRRK